MLSMRTALIVVTAALCALLLSDSHRARSGRFVALPDRDELLETTAPMSSNLAEFANAWWRSVGLEPLSSSSRDQLRIWTPGGLSLPTGRTVSALGSSLCRHRWRVIGGRARELSQCDDTTVDTQSERAFASIKVMQEFDGLVFGCHAFVYDATSTYVEGVFDGHVFRFVVGNAGLCLGGASKVVMAAYESLTPR